MIKRTVMELDEKDVKHIVGDVKRIKFRHENGVGVSNGVRGIFEGFEDYDGEIIDADTVKEEIKEYLVGNQYMERKGIQVGFTVEHRWGVEEDEGEKSSEYTFIATVVTTKKVEWV